ncbi:hypothetical protein HCN44_007261 [Aphidius gifuensis]|uniref:Peroxisomal membrane protein PEX13 n=1 Tax=Aphidius gifuensis TaxID=684658 RepID=A0A834XQ99_APHGI|nr:peroxisomal membrane protein PEX13 [Aphidius gifuensis]KAF7988951.1 hypothetical protein HCN44_007261 [Aphidius gifuensis]
MNQQRPTTSNFRVTTPGGMSNGPTRYGNQMSLPPPIPPRRQVNNYGTHFNMTPSYLGGYNNNYGYNSFPLRSTSYNNYGNFNGPSGDVESRLIQYAEETSRPAFESIESIVTTFSSITMMLESTLFAMSSSFRAILAVADNIGKVRNMFGQILNTFILIKYAKKLYKYILFKLGLREDDPDTDLAWKKAFLDSVNDKKLPTTTTWPIFIFLSLIFVIPYLIHKIMKNINTNDFKEKTLQDWLQINEPVYSATVMYDFQAATSNELTIKCGQKIWLAPESLQPKNNPGWCKASNGTNIGLVPSNYIQIVGEMKKKNKLNNENKNDDDLNTTMEETFNNNDKKINDPTNHEVI